MLELLGILVLLRLRGYCNTVISAPVSQETDSMVCKYITKKMYTSSESIAPVLQEQVLYCSEKMIELHCGHVRGLQNTWADSLSRRALDGFDSAKRRRPNPPIHSKSFWKSFCPPPYPQSRLNCPVWEFHFRTSLRKLRMQISPPRAFQGRP